MVRVDVAAWIWEVRYSQIRYRYCNKLQTLGIKFCTVLPRLSQHLCVSSFVQYYPGYHNTFVYQVLYSTTPVITTPLGREVLYAVLISEMVTRLFWIYILLTLYNIKICTKVESEGLYISHCTR